MATTQSDLMPKVAYLVYSPDDGGFYAELVNADGETIGTVPKDGIFKTKQLMEIHLRDGWPSLRFIDRTNDFGA